MDEVVHTPLSALRPFGQIRDPDPAPPDEEDLDPQNAEPTVGTLKAAEMLGVTYATLNRYFKRGYIPYVQLPSGRKRVKLRDIRALQQKSNLL